MILVTMLRMTPNPPTYLPTLVAFTHLPQQRGTWAPAQRRPRPSPRQTPASRPAELTVPSLPRQFRAMRGSAGLGSCLAQSDGEIRRGDPTGDRRSDRRRSHTEKLIPPSETPHRWIPRRRGGVYKLLYPRKGQVSG